MATMAPGPTTTATITPPRSSHGIRDSWGYNESEKDAFDLDMNPPQHSNHDDVHRTNGNSHISSYHSGHEQAHRVNSSDQGTRLDHTELKPSPSLDDGSWSYSHHNGEDRKRNSVAVSEGEEDSSKWIHRDKLAKIESQELQAAGIFIPRARAASKQRRERDRDRSRSAMRRGTDASEHSHHARSRKNSSHESRPENVVNSWDIRTPEEIAEEESNAYFAKPAKGGSRIPVAKMSPAPLVDSFDRASTRKITDSPEDEPLTNYKTRSRSASMKGSDAASLSGGVLGAKRSVTDVSPKKQAPRKVSGPKTGQGRPKTRSGSNKDSNGSVSTRPSTRSGELNVNKAPEGDPPWMINSYKPDPRLPPDQQLLPTVARRLQQEKWEKEGKFGDVYDKDFRPLNDHVLKPPEPEQEKIESTDERQAENEWPLKLEPAKSPTRLGSSYSTMPKIQDTPHTPLASPRTPVTPHAPHEEASQQTPKRSIERRPEPVEDDKGGCGCCVVM